MWLWLEPGAKFIIFQEEAVFLKPEKLPSVEQVLAAMKSDATLANVPKTICFPLFLNSRRATLSGELRRRVSFLRLEEGRKAPLGGALYWESNSENRAVAEARRQIPLVAKSTQGRHFVTVKKR